MGPGDVKIRDAQTIRFIQAVTGGLQVFMGYAGVAEVIPHVATILIMASVGAIQAGLALWNSGLHNEPTKPYEPPKL